MECQGPFCVIEKVNMYDCRINIRGKIKTYHGNILKRYFSRQAAGDESDDKEAVSCISVIDTEEKVRRKIRIC